MDKLRGEQTQLQRTGRKIHSGKSVVAGAVHRWHPAVAMVPRVPTMEGLEALVNKCVDRARKEGWMKGAREDGDVGGGCCGDGLNENV